MAASRYFTSVLLAVVSMAAGSAFAETSGTVLDMVIASIDGEPVTSSDLKKFMSENGETTEVTSGDGAVRKQLRELVLVQLIEKEAQAIGITVSDEDIQHYIKEVQRQNRVDEESFSRLLQQQGMTLEQYRREVRGDILRARVISSRVRQKIQVVDQDVDRYLKEHPERLPAKGRHRIDQIFIKYPESENDSHETLRAELVTMRERLQNGESFSEVGGEHYRDLGFVAKEELKEELQTAASGLDTGAVSDVVVGSNGFYIIRVAEESAAEIVSESVRDEVRKELFETQLSAALDKFFNDELPAKYNVEIKL